VVVVVVVVVATDLVRALFVLARSAARVADDRRGRAPGLLATGRPTKR